MIQSSANPLFRSVLAEDSPAEASSLRQLTIALARGDDAAWMEFHRIYGPGIFRSLLGATRGNHDLASEALQLTYLRIARHARPCEIEGQFIAWTRLVARSALNDCFRRQRSFHGLLQRPAEEICTDADPLTDEHSLRALDQALSQLADDDRLLLESKYFLGRKVKALAAEMKISPKAVESRLTRARAELRRHLLTALASS